MALPEGVRPYKRTPRFTAQSVPAGLLKDHSLKAGTWGLLRCHAGSVRYFLQGDTAPQAVLQAGDTQAIPPECVHFVALSPDAEFSVEFHR